MYCFAFFVFLNYTDTKSHTDHKHATAACGRTHKNATRREVAATARKRDADAAALVADAADGRKAFRCVRTPAAAGAASFECEKRFLHDATCACTYIRTEKAVLYTH